MTEELAKQLVNQGKARLTHCYSKKSGRYYDTTVYVAVSYTHLHGEYDSDAFMGEISSMVSGLVKTYEAVKGADVLMQSERKIIGSCPACGSDVCETARGWFCRDKSCKFALWKENRFFQTLGKQMTEELAKQLVNQGKARLTHCYSKKSIIFQRTSQSEAHFWIFIMVLI